MLFLLLFAASAHADAWKWRGGLPAGTTVNSAAWDCIGTRYFLATHGRGMFVSEDNGESWSAVNNGLQHQTIRTVQTQSNNPSTLWVGTAGGWVYVSHDGGETWGTSNAGLANLHVRHLLIDSANPQTLFAATAAGVYRSVDGGNSWASSSDGITSAELAHRAPSTD